MTAKIVACHQPNFLPWLGYFAKLRRADVFFLLDDVQFTTGTRDNWTTRVRVLTHQAPLWLAVPVLRTGHAGQSIRDVAIDRNDSRWRRKVLATLAQSYARAPFFGRYFARLEELLSQEWERLCPLNVELIRWLAGLLGLETEVRLSSECPVGGASNERLIALTRAVGGSVYLSGDGADDYQVAGAFAAAGLELRKVGFRHPVYAQRPGAEFVPGLSALDALFRLGADETRRLLEPSP